MTPPLVQASTTALSVRGDVREAGRGSGGRSWALGANSAFTAWPLRAYLGAYLRRGKCPISRGK